MKRLLPLLLLCQGLLAQPFPRKELPPALRSWVPWALDGSEEKLCPAFRGSTVCAWPSRVVLTLAAKGGTFRQDVAADRPLFASIAGGARQWPQEVRLDGQPAAVVEKDGRPAVWLLPGAHRVEGRFFWERLPDSLPVSPRTALVDLSVEGRTVSLPKREEDGLLLLRHQAAAEGAGEELRLKVFRRVKDGIPLWVETRLSLEVSGKAREVRLAGALLPGSVPTSVRGELPARLDAERALRVQVRPGKFAVSVEARLHGNPTEIRPPAPETAWPAQEIWVFERAETLRQVEVTGPVPIDPSRTDMPEEWRRFPAFLVEGTALKVREARRGEPEPAPDQVNLVRSLWLDLDGGGYSVQDRFSGTLGKTSRLNVRRPAQLGRVSVDGQDQLVTSDPATKLPGVELRHLSLNVGADARLPRQERLSAVGWDINVRSLAVSLNLPPGWRLLAAPGSDGATGSWISQWTLLGFFVVLLVGIAMARLSAPRWGLLALVTLALCYREPGAPWLVWISLLVALALMRYLPQGKARAAGTAYFLLSFLALAVIAVTFFISQIREGLYPQAEAQYERFEPAAIGGFAAKSAGPPAEAYETAAPPKAAAPVPAPAERKAAERIAVQSFGNVLSSATDGGAQPGKTRTYEVDPHAVVQTGAGIPDWSWKKCFLTWSGPVAHDHDLRLLLLPPAVNLFLALLRVGLVALLALRLFADAGLRPRLGSAAAAPAAAAALLLFAAFPLPARAEDEEKQDAAPASPGSPFPSSELLADMKEKLLRPAPCAPACVSTADLTLAVEGGELRISAEVHAAAPTAWALPGPAASWVPSRVALDRQEGPALVRMEDGFLYVRLAPGVHRVELAGPLPPGDSLSLQLLDRPRRANALAAGWQVDGIREDGTSDGSIQLTRRLKSSESKAAEGVYEPWLEIRRVLDIGVSWRADTIVRRITPAGTPVVVKVPLLKGMLTTGDEQVKDGAVLVTLGRDQTEARWASVIRPVEGQELVLKAAEGKPWSEVWVIRASPVWQATAQGLPPVRRQDGGQLVSEYRPWPGETLKLTFKKPAGADGQTVTVDSARLDVQPGTRLLDATLSLSVRAARAGPLEITVPKGAEVQAVTVGGQKKPIRPEGDKVVVTVEAGSQPVVVSWRQDGGLSAVHRAPRVAVGKELVNVHVSVQLPPDRWLLMSGGPAWGPALLFWGYALVLLLAALLLGRFVPGPLPPWSWALLGLGLAPLSVVPPLIVAAWFLLLWWRGKKPLESPLAFDLVQLGLVFWTLLFLGSLYGAVHQGLLLSPDMMVTGNGSSATLLRWYVDRTEGMTPAVWVLSVPLWVYRVAMLLWSLWLAFSLLRWMAWGFRQFGEGGLWRRVPRRTKVPPPPPVPNEQIPESPAVPPVIS